MELDDYNGWENKFTWLMHLHLSNEFALLQEIAALVAGTPYEQAAGQHIRWWVEDAVTSWVLGSADRDCFHDGQVRLLAWDLVGTALAYADWDGLVKLLMGQTPTCDNVFTMTLHEWFREQVDKWVEASVRHRQQAPSVLMLVHHLIHNTFGLVAWEHVGRAFRPE